MDKKTAWIVALAVVGVLVVALAGWWLPQVQANSGGSFLSRPAVGTLAWASEGSQPWGGTTTGDAGPYDDDEWSDMMALLYTYDNDTEGVIPSNITGYTGNLAVTNSPTTTLTISTGCAIADGKFYWNGSSQNLTTTLSAPGTGSKYWRVVLRKNFSAQTVRATVLGPETGGYPALTQNTTYWDVPLYRLTITSGGAATLTDDRTYITVRGERLNTGGVSTAKIADNAVDDTKVGDRVPQIYRRQGGSATDWSTVGTTTYTPGAVRMQTGVITVTLNNVAQYYADVTFPTAFSYAPNVFTTLQAQALSIHGILATGVTNITTTGCRIHLSTDNVVVTPTLSFSVNWLAIGPE